VVTSRLGRFNPRERVSGTHWIGDLYCSHASEMNYEWKIIVGLYEIISNEI